MKRIFLSMTLVVLTITLTNAQDTTNTIFKFPKITHVGIYVAPEFQYGQLKNSFTTFGGNSVMLLFNRNFAFGLSMLNSLDKQYSPSGIYPLYLRTRMNGLKLEYVINANKSVHISIPLFIGVSNSSTDSVNYTRNFHQTNDSLPFDRGMNRGGRGRNSNQFAIVQPGIQVEANLFKYLKVYAGAYYRYAWKDSRQSTLSVSTLNGFSANIGAKIGIFDIATKRKK